MSGMIHVGDIGTVIEVTIKNEDDTVISLAGATVRQFVFRKPDHVEVTKTATLSTDGTDGKCRYVTVAGDIDQEGDWHLQVYIEDALGKWHSTTQTFSVRDNLA